VGGAYTAKPAVVSAPDVPPGWNPDWQFPGPFPPGYTADYSIAVTGPDSVAYDGTADVTAYLCDHTDYKTQEPAETSVLVWSAKLGGETVNLKFSGGDSYAAIATSVYTESDGFWGAEPSLEFELTDAANGETLTLTVVSIVDGETLTKSQEVEVGGTVAEVVITAAETGNGLWSCAIRDDADALLAQVGYAAGMGLLPPTNNVPDEIEITTEGLAFTVTFMSLRAGSTKFIGSAAIYIGDGVSVRLEAETAADTEDITPVFTTDFTQVMSVDGTTLEISTP